MFESDNFDQGLQLLDVKVYKALAKRLYLWCTEKGQM